MVGSHVILGLGSNEGDRIANLLAAIRALDLGPDLGVRRISPLYESDAMLTPGAPEAWNQPFLNLAVECSWKNRRPSPENLLAAVKAVEVSLGRKTRERWAPRTIDIDILDWDGESVAMEGLTIPHAGLTLRPFALLPLLDLWPNWRAPGVGGLALRWRLAVAGDEGAVPFRTRRAERSLTRLMGVLNLTPDSFSDGGQLSGDVSRALEQARRLLSAGAEVLDLGAESTRPGAAPITVDEELGRLLPVLEALRAALPDVKLSVDTRRASVARRALEAGADWINDVGGFSDAEMIAAVRNSSCRVVAMHSLGIPPSRERVIPLGPLGPLGPSGEGGAGRDPIDYLLEWGKRKALELERAGIARERLILDPGIGFGTGPKQAWWVLSHAERLNELGTEILIGHSRKSFLTEISSKPAADRDLETAVLSAELAARGVSWLRVHDADSSARAIRSWLHADGVIGWRA